jgi:hypothetical protein
MLKAPRRSFPRTLPARALHRLYGYVDSGAQTASDYLPYLQRDLAKREIQLDLSDLISYPRMQIGKVPVTLNSRARDSRQADEEGFLPWKQHLRVIRNFAD